MLPRLKQSGFTLIEMLVIAPIVILAIGSFLTVIISMTGEVLASRGSNTLTYNIQDAISRIEQDVKQSSTFIASNNVPLAGQQGFNNDTATPFTNVGGASGTSLILNSVVTNDNPTTTTTGMVFLANSPNACGDVYESSNNPMTMNIVYFVKDNTLWRRTIMPSNYATIASCSTPWQRPSCAPNYTDAFCKANDVKLVEGVSSLGFVVQYFKDAAASTAEVAASDPTATEATRNTSLQSATTVGITINAAQTIAGRNIERSGNLRATRLDTNASTIASTNATYYNILTNASFETALTSSYVARTNLNTNPSLEISTAGYALYSGSTITRQTASAITGSYGLRVSAPAAASADAGVYLPTLPVTAGVTYTISVDVRAVTAGTYRLTSVGYLSTSVAFTAGQVKTLTITFTATSATSPNILVLRTGTGTLHNFDVDKVLYIASMGPETYFSGDTTTTTDDYTYKWTGTDGLSTSTESARRLPNLVSTYRVLPVQSNSNNWSSNGTNSLRLIPNSTTINDSFVDIMAMIPGGVTSLKPDTQYTIKAKMRLAAPLTGTLQNLGGSQTLSIFAYFGGSLRGFWSGTNTAGVQSLGGTFTTPSNFTGTNALRLYHGGFAGAGDVWWDDVMLIEGNYGGTAFIPGS